ncbi:hypothetical protein SB6423_00596 [Klebsiella pasteurii]|uniref:ead/Ea22-like family protein n=1 Tax=Klebsiella pasteurii TaxID=2587529 RepID=UPI00115BEC2A|nr:ead/Ea22-like family protein [Klebsiella pasteurii]VUS29909.1 hypothetical protein SB6423_00596 [Klebsiella pasteurii]
MTNMTELTAEKLEEIRKRYRPTEVPKCHICGAEMTIQRMSASRITYGCTGAIYDETGCHYAEGRSLADDHYAESRITVVDVSDPDVLAMVEALEKAQQRIGDLEREQEHLRPVGVMSEKAFHRLENSESRFIALWPRPGIFLPRKHPEDGVIVYARTAAAVGTKVEAE